VRGQCIGFFVPCINKLAACSAESNHNCAHTNSSLKGNSMHKGSCLCGAVSFVVAAELGGDLGAPDACHCSQCRKQSGHYFESVNVARAALTV